MPQAKNRRSSSLLLAGIYSQPLTAYEYLHKSAFIYLSMNMYLKKLIIN